MHVDLLTGGSFPWMPQILKYFKVSNFLASQSRDQIARVVETERHLSLGNVTERYLFFGKCIVTLSPTVHIKLDAVVHAKSHRFSLLPSSLLLFIHCSLYHSTFHHTMTGETDQTSNVASDVATSGVRSVAGMESKAASTSSSSNIAI
jgi:hypothetical protein